MSMDLVRPRPLEPPPGWRLDNDALRRDFVFADFVEAFGFMARVALVAEAMNHHPDWSNSWNRVTVSLTTHDVGAVTDNDVRLAERINQLADG